MFKNIKHLSEIIYDAINEAFDFNEVKDSHTQLKDSAVAPDDFKKQFIKILNKQYRLSKYYDPFMSEIIDPIVIKLNKTDYYSFCLSDFLATKIIDILQLDYNKITKYCPENIICKNLIYTLFVQYKVKKPYRLDYDILHIEDTDMYVYRIHNLITDFSDHFNIILLQCDSFWNY